MYTHFTVQGIQMESILSNKYYIRDFIKNTLLIKQESTVKGAKVSPHFIPKFLNSNHRVRFQIVLAQINNTARCVFIGVSASEYTQCNSMTVRIKANSQQAIRAPVSGGGIIKVFLQRSTTRHY